MDTHHYSAINRLMLRFRPIAPRPAAAGDTLSSRIGAVRRTKRKYVRVRGKKTIPSDKSGEGPPPEKSEVEDGPSPERTEITLQLLPVRSDQSGSSDRNQYRVGGNNDEVGCVTAAMTWIVVERVTDTYADGGIGLTDAAEIMKKLSELRIGRCKQGGLGKRCVRKDVGGGVGDGDG